MRRDRPAGSPARRQHPDSRRLPRPAQVGLARIALRQCFFSGRARVDDRQGDGRFALLHVDAACGRTDRTASAAERAAAARIVVGGNDIGLQEIIGGLDLGFAEVGSLLQFALVGHGALHRAALHAATAVDHAETTRVLDEHLEERLGAAEFIFTRPLVVRFDDRDPAKAPYPRRDQAPGALLRATRRRSALCHAVLIGFARG